MQRCTERATHASQLHTIKLFVQASMHTCKQAHVATLPSYHRHCTYLLKLQQGRWQRLCCGRGSAAHSCCAKHTQHTAQHAAQHGSHSTQLSTTHSPAQHKRRTQHAAQHVTQSTHSTPTLHTIPISML